MPNLAFNGIVPQLPTVIQVENYDTGGQGVSFFDFDPENQGGVFRDEAVDIENSGDTDGTPSIGWAFDSEWLEYTIDVAPGATSSMCEQPAFSPTLAPFVSLSTAKTSRLSM